MTINKSMKRRNRLIKEKRHDVYKDEKKNSGVAECKNCSAFLSSGKWSWRLDTEVEKIDIIICPACRRMADKYPAGLIKLKGEFLFQHYNEITNLVNNVNDLEKNERPMERVMSIKKYKKYVQVATTGVHIARRIGEALSKSYGGNYSFKYGDNENSIRVTWER